MDKKAIGLVGPDSKSVLMTDNATGKKESIFDYFKRKYNYVIKFPFLPLLHIGNPARTTYVPLELTSIKEQVTIRKSAISDLTTGSLLDLTNLKLPRYVEVQSCMEFQLVWAPVS